jgi:hypothetical protein
VIGWACAMAGTARMVAARSACLNAIVDFLSLHSPGFAAGTQDPQEAGPSVAESIT